MYGDYAGGYKMLKIYPAIFHNEKGGYWVEFPDLEGCQSYGDTLEETMQYAQEALGIYIASKLDNNDNISESSDIKNIDCKDGFVSYVTADVSKYRTKTKSVKKTLTIPEWLNEEAEKKHINFSSILQKALIQELQK